MKKSYNWMVHQVGIVMIAGIIMGLLVFYGQDLLGLQPFTILMLCIAVLLVLMIGRTVLLQRKIKANYALYEAGKIDEYVTVSEELLSRTKQPSWYTVIALNLSAGYLRQGAFDKASDLLQNISMKKMIGPTRSVYYNNYAAALFRAGKVEEALELLDGHENELDLEANEVNYLDAMRSTRGWLLAATGKTREARTLIATLRKENDAKMNAELDEIEAYLAKGGATE